MPFSEVGLVEITLSSLPEMAACRVRVLQVTSKGQFTNAWRDSGKFKELYKFEEFGDLLVSSMICQVGAATRA